MMEFPEALCAGILIALVCSCFGVFVVLKRLVFLGVTLLEAAACGIAAGFFFRIQPFWGALVMTLSAVTLLAFPAEEKRIPRDALMAVIFILTSSLGILWVSRSAAGLEEIKGMLYGDLIITSKADLKLLFWSVVPAAMTALIFFRPILYAFLDRDHSRVLRMKTRFWELLFFYATAIVIAASSRLGGVLLVFCHLVIPPVAGLLLCGTLGGVFLVSIILAIFSTLAGFYIAYTWDFPVNPVIAVLSCFLLFSALAGKGIFGRLRGLKKINI